MANANAPDSTDSAPTGAPPPPASKKPPREKKPPSYLTPVLNNMGPMGIPIAAVRNDSDPSKIDEPAETVYLPHGLSYVPSSKWARAKEQQNLRLALKAKIKGTKAPEWRGVKVGAKHVVEFPVVDATDPLGKLSEDDAVEQVGEVDSVAVLGQLAKLDKRPRVVAVIKERKADIEKRGAAAAATDDDAGDDDADGDE